MTQKIEGPHCQQCGSTDPEDVNPFGNDGYSLCCNERIVYTCTVDLPDGDDLRDCYHDGI